MSKPRPGRPPPPVPKPGQVKVFRSLYPYTAQQTDELSFDEGDTLYILDMTSSTDWWKAKCGNKIGLIPSNYVESSTESIDFPLHEAAKRGNVPFLQECLNNNIDRAYFTIHVTPASYPTNLPRIQKPRWQGGVSVNGLDKAGSIPLHWASHGGHIDCVKILLAVPNCQVNVQNKIGDTPVHSAAWKGHPEVVKLLIEHGAQVDVRNNERKRPYDLAKDPETLAQLKLAAAPRTTSQDYGDEEDSD